jgi:hypothetical protein
VIGAPMTYRSPVLSVPELFDELMARGRAARQAGIEMIRAIEDGKLTFLEMKREIQGGALTFVVPQPMPCEDQTTVAKWVVQTIQAYIAAFEVWPRQAGPSLMLGVPEYVSALRVLRSQCEALFGLAREAEQSPAERLTEAPIAEIHRAITDIFDEAKKVKAKAPNRNELPGPVRSLLKERGFRASGNRIKKLSDQPQHANRRGPVGKRVSG